MDRRIEILAPAGSYEGMRAAMNAGCDAVYIGGSSFGARAYANNPEEETLLKAIDEAHIRGKKLYLTVNTLLKEKERSRELYRFLEKFYLQGLDAVIVQDLGVLHFISRNFPGLPVHASTQMTLSMAEGANLLKNYGVTRLVPARELSLKELTHMRANTDLEIETFVHGALCYCYSGQCLMSSMIGGRSGNRGRCAQPCRMPYQFYSEDRRLSKGQEKYLLSPKDINTITILPQLIEAGIDSFKIEGRMKRPEYAAAVARMYRKYTDLYLQNGQEQYHKQLQSEEYRRDILRLQDVYNRGGFSEGYGNTYNGKSMMSLYRPNHSGVYVGVVSSVKGSQVTITLEEDVNAQDILEIRHQEEEGYEFTVKDSHKAAERLTTNIGVRPNAGERGGKEAAPGIKVGAKVYRTRNNQLLEQIADEYLRKDKQQPMEGLLTAKLGEQLSFTISCMGYTATAYQGLVQEAQKQPMTREKLLTPLEKTGDTLFYFDRLTLEMDENIFVPVAWLNEIRRESVAKLQEQIANGYRRSPAARKAETALAPERSDTGAAAGICVSVQTREQFDQVIAYAQVDRIYADYDTFTLKEALRLAVASTSAGKELYLSLPQICRLETYERLKEELSGIIDKREISGFLVKNLEELALLQSLESYEHGKKLTLNYNMYTYNKEAKSFFQELSSEKSLGITEFTAPVELNYQELSALGIGDSDLTVYGYQPVMISAQCLYKSTEGCKKCIQGNTGRLADRLGKSFYVRTYCKGCYNILYNGQPLSLIKYKDEIDRLSPGNLRLDFTRETGEEVRKVMAAYLAAFFDHDMNVTEPADYTTGHFKRGVE